MRIVVISDTHGKIDRLEAVLRQQPRADYFLHLGDLVSDAADARLSFPDRNILCVAGNGDFGTAQPLEDELVVSGKQIFYTHGHKYYVKSGYGRIIQEAQRRGADILLFGHTHVAYCAYEEGLYIMNPGSLGYPDNGRPTYGVIDITAAGIVTNIAEV